MQTLHSSALDVLKSHGEGSRGGHVIGHTRSGKPVYSTPSGKTGAERQAHFHDWTAQDHGEARNIAHAHAQKVSWENDGLAFTGMRPGTPQHEARHKLWHDASGSAIEHGAMARAERMASPPKGSTLGNTASGKPIINDTDWGVQQSASSLWHAHDSHKYHVNSQKKGAETIGDMTFQPSTDDDVARAKESLDYHHADFQKRFPDFTAQDHADAAAAHQQAAMSSAAGGRKKERHVDLMRAHAKAARLGGVAPVLKSSSALDALQRLAKAEGARGGHIIGHSKSGRPIYEAKGTKRELLHKLDGGFNHVAVASSLKHKHYIGMTPADHFARAARHTQRAVGHVAKGRRAETVKAAAKHFKTADAHKSLARAHAMMGQLSHDVRTPDHIREAAAMHDNGTHDKAKLTTTKERYFSTLSKVGHQRAVSRHAAKAAQADEAGHKATGDHHTMMASAHQAVLHGFYGDRE